MEKLSRTPLFEEHVRLGARMVGFAGWEMPIQYKGLREEHDCVRTHVGLFDVSHMGEIRFKGPQALKSLDWLTTNDVSKLEDGQAHYSLLPNAQGGLVDDIYVYCLKKNQDYLVCVNAANIQKDFEWMKTHNQGAELTNESDSWGQIAVQGPKAPQVLDEVLGFKVSELPKNAIREFQFQGHLGYVATTGYTGENGGEVFIQAAGTAALWQELLKKGANFGVQPIGLGARDTLRTEMKYSLYGNEIDDHSSPYEAGLGWVIKPTKKDFIGKSPILASKEGGLKRQLVGFKMLEKGIPRHGYVLFSFDNKEIGLVTSGTHSPSLDEPIGIGYVQAAHAAEGSQILVDIRGRKVKAQVVSTPFLKK
ncbi:MAG: glycine cleavage system aminomethyltransferase GcvT [Proteobacteria bacterium]|jgi:aminomethyltransferase|nr:glycine cleavage system aminomethyltransferase GcvT [Pseudomonadota bacterium]